MYRLEDGITYTMISDWTDCRQRALFKAENWEKDGPEKESLAFGTIVHRLLEWYYKGWGVSDLYEDLLKKNPESEFLYQQAWIVFNSYTLHYANDKLETLNVEHIFDVKWYGFRLRGKLDRLVVSQGNLADLESKTTSRFDDDTGETFLVIDEQGLFYNLAIDLEGYDCNEMIRDIIRKPQIQIRKNENEESFLSRLAEDISSRPDFYYQRIPIVYNEEQVKTYRKGLRIRLYAFRRWLKGKEATYSNNKACITKWTCDFLEACSTCTMAGYSQTRKHYRELEKEDSETDKQDVKKSKDTGYALPKKKLVEAGPDVGDGDNMPLY